MSFNFDYTINKEIEKKFKRIFTLNQLQSEKDQRKTENCKYRPNGNYITYSAKFESCIKCGIQTGRFVYQTRCGEIYCKTCMNVQRTSDQMISCIKCKAIFEVIIERDKNTTGNNVWQCLCFNCFYGLI